MKVIQILPGSGGTFYCENCMRDAALVKAMRRQGHDVIMVPMYLPLYTDDPDIAKGVPVFFGGINVYLQQQFPIFRKTPRWMDRILDSRPMLWLASRQEGSTRAKGMGEMTLSMLHGEDGNQAKELERLTQWLAQEEKPDLVHISTTMLLGLARRIKEVLNVPVVCTMQDEDVWLDNLEDDYPAKCWKAIAEKTKDCDRFVTSSRYYRDLMVKKLKLDPDSVDVVPVGIDMDGYRQSQHGTPPALGYLSKLTPALGLETLVDAFILLRRKDGLNDLKLRAIGGQVGEDKLFVESLRSKLDAAGMETDAEFLEELDREARITFMESLSVLSVPVPDGKSIGTIIIEAWAAGVPVVQPRVGPFPELVEGYGGGIVYEGSSPDKLAEALEPLLRDPATARELGQTGRKAALENFEIGTMAERMAQVYAKTKSRKQ